MLDIIENGSFNEIIGAFLALEYSIPAEYEKITTGVQKAFPDNFKINTNDSHGEKQRKAKNLMYPYHHAIHDRDSHYPDLERVVAPLLENPAIFEEVKQGAMRILSAKKQFFQGMERTFDSVGNNKNSDITPPPL